MKKKNKKKIILVAGARPNFMKIAPILAALKQHQNLFELMLVHTGQHYDFKMSQVFFQDLGIPHPDVFLNVGSASHTQQTAKIMIEFEKVVESFEPDLVVVVGDVNSTLACALVAAKLNIAIAHVEAGLRSFDREMPEEINRLVTDAISDYLYVSEPSGLIHLKQEGVDPNRIIFVGNVMIDTLISNLSKIESSTVNDSLNLKPQQYAVVTLHRPANVDSKENGKRIVHILKKLSSLVPLVYPIHPRSKQMFQKHGLLTTLKSVKRLTLLEPLGYCDFIKLIKDSRFVLTDSGGIQEETTFLKIPCLTMRENTERPSTITMGSNRLVGLNPLKIKRQVQSILKQRKCVSRIPPLWDGKAALRIVNHFRKIA